LGTASIISAICANVDRALRVRHDARQRSRVKRGGRAHGRAIREDGVAGVLVSAGAVVDEHLAEVTADRRQVAADEDTGARRVGAGVTATVSNVGVRGATVDAFAAPIALGDSHGAPLAIGGTLSLVQPGRKIVTRAREDAYDVSSA
jgi:hypothetical protein